MIQTRCSSVKLNDIQQDTDRQTNVVELLPRADVTWVVMAKFHYADFPETCQSGEVGVMEFGLYEQMIYEYDSADLRTMTLHYVMWVYHRA